MSSTEMPTPEPLTTTSFTLLQIDLALRPTEAVACMNCPLAAWMLDGQAVKCYCRMLYTFTWESTKPGKIKICDGPALAQAAAEAREND